MQITPNLWNQFRGQSEVMYPGINDLLQAPLPQDIDKHPIAEALLRPVMNWLEQQLKEKYEMIHDIETGIFGFPHEHYVPYISFTVNIGINVKTAINVEIDGEELQYGFRITPEQWRDDAHIILLLNEWIALIMDDIENPETRKNSGA